MSELSPEDEKALEDIVLSRLMRLNATVFGVVLGLVFGLVVFIATIWLVLKGGEVIGPHLGLLGHFFIGYRVTFLGSFIGLIYGFVIGFLVGFLIATLYNWIVELKDSSRVDES